MTAIFDPEFRKTLGEILRRAPRVRGVGQQGVRSRRRRRSESGTFSEHRPYSEGDDLRNLDWNVYARTDELFHKVLEDEDRIGLTLILDRSKSMLAGDRWTAARRMTAILAGLALVQFDGLRLVGAPGRTVVLYGAASLPKVLDRLETLPHREDSPREIATYLLENESVGRLTWVSDFADPQQFALPLRMLRKAGSRVTGVLPELRTDRVPASEGFVEFEDPETGRRELMQVDRVLRREMASELARLAKHQDAVFGDAGYPMFRFPVPERGDLRVASWTHGGRVYAV